MAPMPMRRKSQGNIRLPNVKRNIESQVTLEGWLFKLEGGALKQWKQRWCVLVDFCLFFYKAPCEEKITSSILLPSYKINPCSSDDKVSKKFAFKAEHQNMKTYYFAAEDKESMKKWMNAMSLATILQKFTSCSENHSIDDEDSGFTSYRSRQLTNSSSALSKQRSNSCGNRVGEMYLRSDDKYPNHQYKNIPSQAYCYNQDIPQTEPLCSNAPPKPRRLAQVEGCALYPGSYYENREPDLIPGFDQRNQSYFMNRENIDINPYMSDDAYPSCANLDPDLSSQFMYSKNQVPRPHSADFLERENECVSPPYISQIPEKPQPQRPKSSLAYNSPESEGDFDSYRDIVRVQADNLYLNKSYFHIRNTVDSQKRQEHTKRSSSKINTHYANQDPYLCKASGTHPTSQNISREYDKHSPLKSDNTQYKECYGMESSNLDNKESLHRLHEWKQRMLNSSLSKRNESQSNFYVSKSPNTSQPINYEPQNFEFQDQQISHSKKPFVKNYQYHDQNSSKVEFQKSDNITSSPSYNTNNISFQSKDEYVPEVSVLGSLEGSLTNPMTSYAASHIPYQNNNMIYSVDSENNEVLFPYDNQMNSPTTFPKTYYPPQMHSATTFSNINQIGIEESEQPAVYYPPEKSKMRKDSQSGHIKRETVYTSDDEASAESDYRHELVFEKMHSEGKTYSDKLRFNESRNLKKLVQQSHGLMKKGKQLSVSAGDLLGKTHEELVLLLIQLRRNQCKIFKAKEKLENKLRMEKDVLQIENQRSTAHYKELCKQVLHLEKQFEMTQPLVSLVGNMVKLGSLYGNKNRRSFSLPSLDCAGEDVPSSPTHHTDSQKTNILSSLLSEEPDLQKQINKVSNLEKGYQNETTSISSLCQDKAMLEHTLSGMQDKILDHQDRPVELQKLRKQQKMIEKELIRVKRLLSTSAKKIEDAATKNDQMEQEIIHLRHILQQALKTKSTEMESSDHNRADIEAELMRLQSILNELANHRHEINNTVEKLEKEAHFSRSKGVEVRASPTGVAGSAPLPLRKKLNSVYLETDLDSMITHDLAVRDLDNLDNIPVYANAEEITMSNEDCNNAEADPSCKTEVSSGDFCSMQDINEADERMKRFYGILPKEKPSEIKTVRIVKRQSERRNRERDKKKVAYNEELSVWVMEEPDLSSDDYLEIDDSSTQAQPSTSSSPSSSRTHSVLSNRSTTTTLQASSQSEKPRSRDDANIERSLHTSSTPDIVRSTIKANDDFDDTLIDRELGLPQKIEIPERYVEVEPEQLSAREKLKRSLKAENICKMLSKTTAAYGEVSEKRSQSPEALHQKLTEEKLKRAQLLSLNQALAQEVVQRSKAVASELKRNFQSD